MNMELTIEAAEKTSEFLKDTKEQILADLIKEGGVARKEIDSEGRKVGGECILYYSPAGKLIALYDPARAKIAAEA